jgi:Ca-activated chloride channel family protein
MALLQSTGWHDYWPQDCWFAAPEAFWLLLLLPLWWWWVRPRTLPVAATELPALPGTSPQYPRSLRQQLASLPRAAEAAAAVALVTALARPVVEQPLPPQQEGLAVMLCLDTSSSMEVRDLGDDQPRLATAVALAAEFVAQRPHDQVGLVAFARFADLRCPPTLDHEALVALLRSTALVTKESPEDATGIGGAVALAGSALARVAAPGKVVVLLTDGEENVASALAPREIAPLHAAQLCAQLGVRVHTIVTGQGHARPDGSFLPLDTTAAQQLASGSGGRFFRARDAAALQQVYRAIDSLERLPLAPPRFRRVERLDLPLVAGLLLLVLAALGRRLGWEVLP